MIYIETLRSNTNGNEGNPPRGIDPSYSNRDPSRRNISNQYNSITTNTRGNSSVTADQSYSISATATSFTQRNGPSVNQRAIPRGIEITLRLCRLAMIFYLWVLVNIVRR